MPATVHGKCVLLFHFAKSSMLAISNSRHGHTQSSLVLLIWLNENVPKSQAF